MNLQNTFSNSKYVLSTWIIPLTFLTVIAINSAIAFLFIFYKAFDYDEFQHVHIVWDMFHSGKVLYRDFFDHHGFVYPLINYVWFSVLHLQASVSTFYVFRYTSLGYLCIILFITFHIARVMFNSRFVSFLSVAILSSLHFFVIKGIEIRPDILQNVFWLSGLYFVIVCLRNTRSNLPLLAGLLFGLAIMTNTKAGLGIAIVFLFLCLELFRQTEKRKEMFHLILKLIGGISLVHVIAFVFLFSQGLLGLYLFDNYAFNFALAGPANGQAWMFLTLWSEVLWTQFPFVLASALGIILMLRELFFKAQPERLLFIMVTIGCSLGTLVGLYTQFFLMFLPLLAVVCAYCMYVIISHFATQQAAQAALCIVMCAAFFLPMETVLLADGLSLKENHSLLSFQIDTTNFILKATDRSEAVGYFWNQCGGATFNEDVQYNWWFDLPINSAYERISGKDPYNERYIAALMNTKVRYIIGNQYQFDALPSEATRLYIENNYHYIRECILERNNS